MKEIKYTIHNCVYFCDFIFYGSGPIINYGFGSATLTYSVFVRGFMTEYRSSILCKIPRLN
jgi:hypothetical protein